MGHFTLVFLHRGAFQHKQLNRYSRRLKQKKKKQYKHERLIRRKINNDHINMQTNFAVELVFLNDLIVNATRLKLDGHCHSEMLQLMTNIRGDTSQLSK